MFKFKIVQIGGKQKIEKKVKQTETGKTGKETTEPNRKVLEFS
jgi:hypothetical protein